MDIPKTHPNWARLVVGSLSHEFKVVSASLMLSRIVREFKNDPTPAKKQASIDEFIAFCSKYEGLLKDDLAQVFK